MKAAPPEKAKGARAWAPLEFQIPDQRDHEMFIAENCFRHKKPPLHLNPEIIGPELLHSLAADMLTSGMIGPSADIDLLVNRVSRPIPAVTGTGGDDAAY